MVGLWRLSLTHSHFNTKYKQLNDTDNDNELENDLRPAHSDEAMIMIIMVDNTAGNIIITICYIPSASTRTQSLMDDRNYSHLIFVRSAQWQQHIVMWIVPLLLLLGMPCLTQTQTPCPCANDRLFGYSFHEILVAARTHFPACSPASHSIHGCSCHRVIISFFRKTEDNILFK